jgi:hypothetical protein
LSGIVAVDGDWTVDDTVWFARRVVNSAFVSIVKDIAYDSVDDNIRWRKKFLRQRHDSHIRGQGDQGSMLCSQFSAIFGNFLQKIGVFLKNQC